MTCFCLFHLSDLHVGAKGCVVGYPDRKYVANFPKGKVKRIEASSWDSDLDVVIMTVLSACGPLLDAVMVTGDLATTGEERDLERARQFLHALKFFAQEKVAPPRTGPNWIVLPGNHDRFEGRLKKAGGKVFERIFSEDWKPASRIDLRRPAWRRFFSWVPGFGLPTRHLLQTTVLGVEGADQLAIVAADFSLIASRHASPPPPLGFDYLGQGRFHDEFTESLIEETHRQRRSNPRRAVVWAVHFPPLYPRMPSDLQLVGEQALVQAAEEAKVHHMFCGHTHDYLQYQPSSSSSLTIYCAGTATQYVPTDLSTLGDNVIHPTEIDVKDGEVTEVRWYPLKIAEGCRMPPAPHWDANSQCFKAKGRSIAKPRSNWPWLPEHLKRTL